MPPETTREKAERYVREGEEYVAGQKAVVAGLKTLGRSTREARALLVLFEESLAGRKRNLAALNEKA
jgi:hypothetical protein